MPSRQLALPAEQQTPDRHVQQDEGLEPRQPVVDQHAAGDRRRKQERHLRGSERQCPALASEGPAPGGGTDEQEGTDQLGGASGDGAMRERPRRMRGEHGDDVSDAEHEGDQISRPAQLRNPATELVRRRPGDQISQRPAHAGSG